MIDGHLFDLMEAVCSAARQKRFYFSKAPENEVSRYAFGGLQIVVCGDFFQLPPVQSRFNSNISFAFESKAWRKTIEKGFVLRNPHRQACPVFFGMLSEIRRGVFSSHTCYVLNATIVGSRHEEPELSARGDILRFTKLLPLRSQVQSDNMRRLKTLPGFTVRYYSSFNTVRGTSTPKIFSSVEGTVDLKQGCPVLCTKNIEESSSLLNGSSGFVVGFVTVSGQRYLFPKLLTENEVRALLNCEEGQGR
ncbi:ATP-dependent DNA helicase PIF1 [Gracilariopsis chorda]|uniref:ATP-dependent DNA helicase n=1 Tax=Gracilariopsis chorda TaxID=448386 RepID=A0A2V3IT29_9FLOR|nr:ATP-dependent DNA helicase PIF1 [Gracilariopsis chorda]|eukprot:PXF44270.1 ATP-dependent DNA helicase PIF1 [Gracilariopsis chorda]